jgi:hypothetical protein
MEKELGRIRKNDITEIVVRVDEYKGKKGLTIREFMTGDKYTGFTKAGTRISAENFLQFREMINSIDYNEFMKPVEASADAGVAASGDSIAEKPKKEKKPKAKEQKTLEPSEEVNEEELAQE